jgi:hypothetical protein
MIEFRILAAITTRNLKIPSDIVQTKITGATKDNKANNSNGSKTFDKNIIIPKPNSFLSINNL